MSFPSLFHKESHEATECGTLSKDASSERRTPAVHGQPDNHSIERSLLVTIHYTYLYIYTICNMLSGLQKYLQRHKTVHIFLHLALLLLTLELVLTIALLTDPQFCSCFHSLGKENLSLVKSHAN